MIFKENFATLPSKTFHRHNNAEQHVSHTEVNSLKTEIKDLRRQLDRHEENTKLELERVTRQNNDIRDEVMSTLADLSLDLVPSCCGPPVT